MSQAAPRFPYENSPREYWKPQRPAIFRVESCKNCKNELVIGSSYCHLCGQKRDAGAQPAKPLDLLDWTAVRKQLGLSSLSLGCAIFGLVCAVLAVLTGVLFNPGSGRDIQTISTWRLEWLIAALAAFTAANLFRKSRK
jgi:hypothetical protein